ncbi:MAG: glycosyltransferase family 4 protein [Chthoniobacteraceae bacterium]
MKVGIVSPEFPPEKGGIQTYAFEFTRELARRGHEVTVFTTAHSRGELASMPFRVEPVLKLRRRFDREILRSDVEIWHAMNASYSWLALEHSRVFITVHGNDFLWPYHPVARLDFRERFGLPFGSNADQWLGGWLTWFLVKRSLPRATHIFANSQYTERRLTQTHPNCGGKTSAAMVGVSAECFAGPRPPRRDGPPRLITVCRLAEPHKNVDLVLQALARIKDIQPFQYTIVGDGYLRASYEKLTHDLGLADRVTFTGFLDRPQLNAQLLDSDLFILTTSSTPVAYEGFGLVYLEANACGCPVLAARIGGSVEAVKEGVSGMFVDEPTADGIGRALAKFFSGGVRFDSEACVGFARQFSWTKVVDHCLAHYTR